jgi:hypothetical protein
MPGIYPLGNLAGLGAVNHVLRSRAVQMNVHSPTDHVLNCVRIGMDLL